MAVHRRSFEEKDWRNSNTRELRLGHMRGWFLTMFVSTHVLITESRHTSRPARFAICAEHPIIYRIPFIHSYSDICHHWPLQGKASIHYRFYCWPSPSPGLHTQIITCSYATAVNQTAYFACSDQYWIQNKKFIWSLYKKICPLRHSIIDWLRIF